MKKFLLLAAVLSCATTAQAGGLALPNVLAAVGSTNSLGALPVAKGEGPICTTVCLPTYRPNLTGYTTRIQYFASFYANPSTLPGLPAQVQSNVPYFLAALGNGATTASGSLGGPAPIPKRPADFIDALGAAFDNAFFSATYYPY